MSGEGRESASQQVDWAGRDWFEAKFDTGGAEDAEAYFGHAESGYQQFRHGQLLAVLKEGPVTPGTMVDLGCAVGDLTALLARELKVRDAIGFDFVPAAVSEASRRYPDLSFRTGALPALEMPDASVDLIVASEVLYYLTPDARREAVQEFHRTLRPGGHVLFTAAMGPAYFTRDSALELFQAGGFGLCREAYLRMGLYHRLLGPFELAVRLVSILDGKSEPGSQESAARLARWKPVLSLAPMRLLIRAMARLAGPLAGNRYLPRLLEGVPLLARRRTNIILLLERGAAGSKDAA